MRYRSAPAPSCGLPRRLRNVIRSHRFWLRRQELIETFPQVRHLRTRPKRPGGRAPTPYGPRPAPVSSSLIARRSYGFQAFFAIWLKDAQSAMWATGRVGYLETRRRANACIRPADRRASLVRSNRRCHAMRSPKYLMKARKASSGRSTAAGLELSDWATRSAQFCSTSLSKSEAASRDSGSRSFELLCGDDESTSDGGRAPNS